MENAITPPSNYPEKIFKYLPTLPSKEEISRFLVEDVLHGSFEKIGEILGPIFEVLSQTHEKISNLSSISESDSSGSLDSSNPPQAFKQKHRFRYYWQKHIFQNPLIAGLLDYFVQDGKFSTINEKLTPLFEIFEQTREQILDLADKFGLITLQNKPEFHSPERIDNPYSNFQNDYKSIKIF